MSNIGESQGYAVFDVTRLAEQVYAT